MRVAIRALDDLIDRTSFRCGVGALDDWIRHHAAQAQRKRLASVWTASPEGEPAHLLGYYCLTPWQIAFEDCPETLRHRLPRYPVHVSLIARMAIAEAHQGKGIGGVLLVDGIRRAYLAGEALPVQAVLVHAKDAAAAAFYLHHGFIAFPHRPLHLFMPMSAVARSLS